MNNKQLRHIATSMSPVKNTFLILFAIIESLPRLLRRVRRVKNEENAEKLHDEEDNVDVSSHCCASMIISEEEKHFFDDFFLSQVRAAVCELFLTFST
jgi:DNA-directed RNA polymerase subunit N (RpoN/RPB10)